MWCFTCGGGKFVCLRRCECLLAALPVDVRGFSEYLSWLLPFCTCMLICMPDKWHDKTVNFIVFNFALTF